MHIASKQIAILSLKEHVKATKSQRIHKDFFFLEEIQIKTVPLYKIMWRKKMNVSTTTLLETRMQHLFKEE